MPEIRLDEEGNESYYELVEEYNELLSRWNKFNENINEFRIPRLLVFGTKKHLEEKGNELSLLQKDYLDWKGKATNFFIKPHYNISKELDGDLIFIHFTNVLRHLVNRMESNMILIANNYNKIYSDYEGQINFIIAIISFLISFSGLILGIITFIK